MMAYAVETCPECKQRIMATDGRMPVHHIRGTNHPCDGSGEFSLEAEGQLEEGGAESIPANSKSKRRSKSVKGKEQAPIVENSKENIPSNKEVNGFKIEKGVPIPARNGHRESKWIGVLSAMEIGDSFVHEWKGRGSPATLLQQAKKLEIKLTVRRINENEMRIWRVK